MRFSDRPLRRPPSRFVTKALCATLATLTCWTPVLVYAQDPEGRYESRTFETDVDLPADVSADELENRNYDPTLRDQDFTGVPANLDDTPAPTEPDPTHTPVSLPGGAEASAATPQAISLPNAEGSIEGMGESFSPVLSSGTATFSVPIAAAPGRAGVQPSLALSYSTTGGNGPVGFGWGMGVPFISRQTDRGLPHYVDQAAWHEQEDRFMYNGGQELVPVDSDAVQAVDEAAMLSGDTYGVPSDVAGWQQYRARVEGGFMRFFRSPDSDRWIVQSKDGTRFDFGLLPSGQGPSEVVTASPSALERDPERTSGGVFQWSLTRMSDPHGSTVYYVYDQHDGRSYLRDVHYVSPADCANSTVAATRECTSSTSEYGAHLHLVYESRGDVFAGYVSGWRVATARRVKRIEVTAYDDGSAQRTLVRRYHLRYDPSSFHSLLTQVQVEGRPNVDCNNDICVGNRSVPESSLGDAVVGELLPPMTFTYTTMPTGSGVSPSIPGFGGIDMTVHTATHSPPHSVDEGRSDLFDVNSDGLPDLIVTDPARYRTADGAPAVGVFFNGFTGSDARPAGAAATFSDAVPMPMRADLSTVLSLSNANVVPMDIDGDGRSDLLHMPRYREYGWWSPTRRNDGGVAEVSPARQGWEWTYAQVDLPLDDTDPRIDLGRDASHIQALDVNNDHLIDIVRTTGTVMQTWVNLGWLPGGDGRFGSYTWNGTEWELSTLPFESCLLQGGTPIDFDDPEVRFGDMNGDGLQDIVQMRAGRIIYWPGRGEGIWGTGSRSCPRGAGAGRYIEMASPPTELSPELDNVFLSDVNMDGASDIVQVRFREVDVWFNRAGEGWTARTIATGTPAAPGFAPRIRFADIDGSTTTDIIWATAGAWNYIDPSRGQRPRLLVGVDNGLGADTTITYGSSAEDYLSDLQAADGCRAASCDRFTWTHAADGPDARICHLSGQDRTAQCTCTPPPSGEGCTEDEAARSQWRIRSSGSPVISSVVRGVSTTDRFDVLGRTAQVTESQFAYHDGYYEGIEQEFRGFGAADAVTVGDWNNPTVYSRTHFLQGRRPHSIADNRLAWSPYEALKGREVRTEVFDEAGAFLSTSIATITNRLLYVGLDGRPIYYAFVSETNELRYDTSPFTAGTGTMNVPSIVREELDASGALRDLGSGATALVEETQSVPIRGATSARIRSTFDVVDSLGQVREQTAHGHVGSSDGAAIDPTITAHTVPILVDGAAWVWRTASSWTTGSDYTGNLGETTNTYASTGDLLSATQVVTSPATYDFGASGDSGEGGAASHTQTDDDLVASTIYDAWGNAIQSCAGADLGGTAEDPNAPDTDCLRFGHVTYDDDFAQFATAEHLAASRDAGGVNYLDYQALTETDSLGWDRGLGAIRSSKDPNGLFSTVTYDGLGRLTSVTPPKVGGCSTALPTTRVRYELTSSPATQPLSRVVTTTELSCASIGADTLTSIAYVDGLGRPRAALSTGDTSTSGHEWVRASMTTLDKKGTVRRTYQGDFYGGSDTDYRAVVALSTETPYAVVRYDAFGRARGVHAEDGSVTWTSYHSLSTDVCDPLDNDPSSDHYRTCTTARTDGHGRVLDQELRNRDPGDFSAESYRLWSYYRADGAVVALVRAQSTGARPASWTTGLPSLNVVRTFVYDSVGRRLSSDDPDTDDPGNSTEATNSWRYLFNRVGDIVAVRDPRGCGQNFFYDLGGRLRGEQYVSCGEAQTSAAELPNGDNSVGFLSAMDYSSAAVDLDVVYHYDEYPTWATTPTDIIPSGMSPVVGRATGVTDRAQRAVLTYDDRGNVVWTARQMALISDELALDTQTTLDAVHSETEYDGDTRPYQAEIAPASTATVEYDETHTYTRTASFDHAGRPTSMTLPEDPDYDPLVTAPTVGGELTYDSRGLPASATATIGVDSQVIVDSIEYLRDGLVGSITYGDDAGGRTPTQSSTTYDLRRRPVRMTTTRDATGGTSGAGHELSLVSTVADQELVWDAANNLVATIDHRDPTEWPAGHRPQSTFIRQDALYRVVGAEFEYTQNDGSRSTVDDGTDWRTEFGQTQGVDPMHQEPAPMVVAQEADRVVSLTWDWDYLANTTEQTDDASSFYERSIGQITNGDDETSSTLRPSALYLATNLGDGTGTNAGWVEVDYGLGGDVEAMTVHGQCDDAPGETCADPGGALATRRSALRSTCACAVEQHYVYRWDELNRLAEARRYDRDASTSGSWELQVRQRYRYDGSNQRTVKQTLAASACADPPSSGTVPCERIALYPYPGDFERRGLVRGFESYDANEDLGTETQYVVAGARMVWKYQSGGVGTGYDAENRLAVGVGDLIQTTSAVFDVRTGALLESSTYYPNGGRETFLNDDDALTAPEVAGFTGKEGDEEVGVTYFGERYLISRLGRWASPDPLHVHASGGGEALNSYHYVGGNLLAARDPMGLCAGGACPGSGERQFQSGQGEQSATTTGSTRAQRQGENPRTAAGPDGRFEGRAPSQAEQMVVAGTARIAQHITSVVTGAAGMHPVVVAFQVADAGVGALDSAAHGDLDGARDELYQGLAAHPATAMVVGIVETAWQTSDAAQRFRAARSAGNATGQAVAAVDFVVGVVRLVLTALLAASAVRSMVGGGGGPPPVVAAAEGEAGTGGGGGVRTLSTDSIRFSQSSVNGVAEIQESMSSNGWQGPPVDVVEMENGMVAADNTRVLAAHRAGIDVQARVHAAGEAIEPAVAERFRSRRGALPTTWGEAIQNRIGRQSAAYRSRNPEGSWATGSSE